MNGRRVCKISGKPFKSGHKVNTVRDVTTNPQHENRPAFNFWEDDSVVDVTQCEEYQDINIQDNQWMRGALARLMIAMGIPPDTNMDASTIISIAATRMARLQEDCDDPVIHEILEKKGMERFKELTQNTP